MESQRRTTQGDVQKKRRRKARQRRREVLARQGFNSHHRVTVVATYRYDEIERMIDRSDYAPVGDDPYYD